MAPCCCAKRHKNVRWAGSNRTPERSQAVVTALDHSGGQGEKMLILTRRVGETVMIGDEVTITVLGVKGNQVRVGINAPKSVAVHREEIYERIQREREGGVNGNSGDPGGHGATTTSSRQ